MDSGEAASVGTAQIYLIPLSWLGRHEYKRPISTQSRHWFCSLLFSSLDLLYRLVLSNKLLSFVKGSIHSFTMLPQSWLLTILLPLALGAPVSPETGPPTLRLMPVDDMSEVQSSGFRSKSRHHEAFGKAHVNITGTRTTKMGLNRANKMGGYKGVPNRIDTQSGGDRVQGTGVNGTGVNGTGTLDWTSGGVNGTGTLDWTSGGVNGTSS